MPLTKKVTFQSTIQKNNKIQTPKLIRWQFKLEPDQVLRIGINAVDSGRGWQFFYAKMMKDGRIRIPRLTLLILQGQKPSLTGYLLDNTGTNIKHILINLHSFHLSFHLSTYLVIS
jgi:hypothetical protein